MATFGVIVAGLLWYVSLQRADLLAFFQSVAERFGLLALALTLFLWNAGRGGS